MEAHLDAVRSGVPMSVGSRRPVLTEDYFRMIEAVECVVLLRLVCAAGVWLGCGVVCDGAGLVHFSLGPPTALGWSMQSVMCARALQARLKAGKPSYCWVGVHQAEIVHLQMQLRLRGAGGWGLGPLACQAFCCISACWL